MSMLTFGSYWYLILLLLGISCRTSQNRVDWEQLAPPVRQGQWILPSKGEQAQPVWGHAEGMQIGISPMPGPRGLLNVYTPYLGHTAAKMINFFAMEPIVKGEKERGFSELEMSSLDQVRGKRFWSSNDSLATFPLNEANPASGVIREINGVETLTVFVFSEPFENGAKVYLRLRFYKDRPYEVEIKTYVTADSRPLEHFIVTATMGNFARLRKLYLKDTVKFSKEMWKDYRDVHFTPHDITGVDRMIKGAEGEAYFIAAPDELYPDRSTYAPGTKEHWKYYGKKAVQFWRKPGPSEELKGLVNGRWAYWNSESPIPGGVSFENFELKTPFVNGDTFVFGVVPMDSLSVPERYDFLLQEIKKHSERTKSSNREP